MIADNIDNIDIYKNVSPDIYAGLLFLKNTVAGIQPGEYKINDNVKAIVSCYETKEKFEKGFEAHRFALDIHYPVEGEEKVQWCPLNMITSYTDYNPDKDVMFYRNPAQTNHVITGKGSFAIFFPGDAHAPQMFVEAPKMVKKIVIKIKL